MPNPLLYINEFASGLYTQRSPMVTPTSAQGLSTVVRTDVLIDGLNIELSNNNTLVRRPGSTRYCSVQFGADYPLNFFTFRNTSGTIKTIVDTLAGVSVFTPSSLTQLYAKGSSAVSRLTTVGSTVYICNGTDAKKYDGNTVTGWGIQTPVTSPTIAESAGPLSPTSGYSWVYTYKNSTSGHESTASPLSPSTGPLVSQEFTLSGTVSSDPQVDKVNIYRTTDGGSVYYLLATIPNTSSWSITGFTDNFADSTLNKAITAPLNHANDAPPAGISNSCFHMNRLWVAVGNLVYFAGGPDTLVGVGQEAFPPANVFAFPGQVTALVSTSSGLLVFTPNDCFIVLGNTSGNFYSQMWQENFGVLSQDCIVQDGDVVFLYTSKRQLFSIDSSLDEIGFPIGDKLLATFNPTQVCMTIHRSGSDSGLFVSDGATQVYRYNISKQAWSPVAIYSSIKTIKSIFVADGDYRLFHGAATTAQYMWYRDLTQFTDDGAVYSAYATIGTIVVAPLGATQTLSAILAERIAVGSDMTISVLLNEISGNFNNLRAVQEPPLLYPSQTVISKRYYLMNSDVPLAQMIRHLQVKISFAPENARNELLGFAILPK